LLRLYSGHKCSCISTKACVIPLPDMFYVNDVLQKETRLLAEWRKLDHSVIVAISQWRRRLSYNGHFEHIL